MLGAVCIDFGATPVTKSPKKVRRVCETYSIAHSNSLADIPDDGVAQQINKMDEKPAK